MNRTMAAVRPRSRSLLFCDNGGDCAGATCAAPATPGDYPDGAKLCQ